MKIVNKLFGFMVLVTMIGSTCIPLVSCEQPVGADPKPVRKVKDRVNVAAMNISEASGGEWDWIAVVDNESRSTMLFNVDEETGKIPTRLYYKPEKDLDVGMTFVCRENGLPEMMEFNGYILYFDNFNGYTFDLAVVAPDETVEYHYGIEYDINFDAWDARIMADGAGRSVFNGSVYNGGRSIVDAFTGGFSNDPVATAIDVVGYLVDLGTCVASIFLPPLLVGCVVGAISQVLEIGLSVLNYFVNDTDFIGEMGEWTINGVNLMIDALGCMAMIVGKKWTDYKGWLDCGAAFITLADVVVGTVQDLFEYFSSSGKKAAVKEEMKPVMGQAKVNFHANGGSGAVPAARTIETANGYGTVTLPAVAGFSRTGYSTLGWYTAPQGNNYYAPGAERMVSGNTSFYVNWIQDVPNAPTGVTAVPVSSSSIKVSWAAFPGAGYYHVYRSTSASGNYERVGGNVSGTAYTDKGLSLNTTYYYKVSAWRPGANGQTAQSAAASAKILPDVPIGVTATAISSSNIRVNWDAFDGATLYYVYRSTSASGTYVKLPGNVSAPLTAFIDSELSANTMYYYKVSAWRPGANGQTAQSAAASARTQAGGSGGGTAPVITTSSLPNGMVGTAYSHTLTASGDTPITWSIESGALPAGLNHNAGVITGTPETPGESHFTVKAVNAAGSDTKQLTIVIATGVVVEMVFVPGGTFQLGKALGTVTGSHNQDVTPLSNVTLSSFYMGKYEVTQAQWQAVMGTTIRQLQLNDSTNYGRGDAYPVYCVTWYNILVFCNKLSMAEGLTPAYRINNSTNPDDWGDVPTLSNSGRNNAAWDAVAIVNGSTGYRLPTEAQWEYAAKGGNPLAAGWVGYTYAGSDTVGDVAWYDGNNGGTFPYGSKQVGTKAPNGLGIHDMSGNVQEWCWDWYSAYSSDADKTDPMGPSSGTDRVKRNACWDDSAMSLLNFCSVDRKSTYPNNAAVAVGFRLARPAQ